MRLELGRPRAGDIPDRMHSITEAAAAARTSVRALRHYEDLGLLSPPRNTRNARVYPSVLVVTVCRIAEMRRLGIPLADIAAALAGLEQRRPQAIIDVLVQRLDRVETQKGVLIGLLEQFEGETARPGEPAPPDERADARRYATAQHRGSSRPTRPRASSAIG